MRFARLFMLGWLGLTQCDSSDGDMATSMGSVRPVDAGAGTTLAAVAPDAGDASAGSAPAAFPADWCDRLGASDAEALLAVLDVIYGYLDAQELDCETAGLTETLSDDQHADWETYLTDYTYLMAGCAPNFETVEGGISVFGPANTPYLDVARSKLAPAEAARLIDYYVQAFAAVLGLSPMENDAVRAYLAEVAVNDIDAAATSTLSTCSSLDAGTD
jgi:hypothetical protein